jgi:hypothetical protein
MLSVAALGSLSNTAEVSSTNLRAGAAFDNLKASWNQALKLGDFSTKMKANYDYNANRDFIKDVEFTGDLVEGGADDVSVSYKVTHDFGAKNTNVELTANTQGTTLSAEYDQADGIKEVSAERDVSLGDQTVGTTASWLVKAQTARVKLMSKLGDSSDTLSATVDYATEGGAVNYEVGYNRNLEAGRDLEATFKPDSKELDVELVDTKFESGATWTASASVPLESSSNILDAAKLTLKRSWAW